MNKIMSIQWEARLAYRRHRLKGLCNYFLNKVDLALRLPIVLSNPIMLHVAVIENICNLSCETCFPFQPDYKRELSFESFKKIFDKFEYIIYLNLSGHGEPFLLKDIFRMIDYGESKNCRVILITNMTLVTEGVAEEIVKSKLTCLNISFDAASPELFEKIRQGAKFDTIVKNIETLNRVKAAHGSMYPALTFQFTAIKDNIKELPGIVELAAQLGVKNIYVKPLMLSGKGLATEEQSLTNYPELRENIFSISKKRAEELGINFVYPEYERNKMKFSDVCPHPWTMPTIYIDGGFLPCCSYFSKFGNAFNDDIGRVWNSKIFRSTRKAARRERSICYYCLKSLKAAT